MGGVRGGSPRGSVEGVEGCQAVEEDALVVFGVGAGWDGCRGREVRGVWRHGDIRGVERRTLYRTREEWVMIFYELCVVRRSRG